MRRRGRFNRGSGRRNRNRNVAHSSLVPSRNYLSTHVAGVSQSLRRTLVWGVGFGGALTADTYTEQAVVLLNSPYDPDAALGGSSAAGFARYMQMYTKCFTLAARIKVKFCGSGTGAGGIPTTSWYCGVTITTFTTSLGNFISATQAGLCDYSLMNVNPDSGVHELSVDIAKFLDKPKVLDDPQLFCTGGSNPTQLIAAHVWGEGNHVSNQITITGFIEVEMDVVFTDPQPFS